MKYFTNGKNVKTYSSKGTATPDHVIRIKSKPLVIDLTKEKITNIEKTIVKAVQKYKEDYKKYFNRNNINQYYLNDMSHFLIS